LKKILHTIAPLFIESHPIGKLLKNPRQSFDTQDKIVERARARSLSMKKFCNGKIYREGIQGTWEGKQNQIQARMKV
jgi:hypothetical protein